MPGNEPILRVAGVVKSFGGVQAVNVDELTVSEGKITALIGPNGAGKTSLFNVLTGFERADKGSAEVRVTDGWRQLVNRPAHQVARLGVVRTFQLTKALAKLSVLDNVRLAAPAQRGERFFAAFAPVAWRKQENAHTITAMELLDRFGLADKATDDAGTLSGGQRKLLEMARALMARPRVVMLDEPMAGVNPALTQKILTHVKALRADGLTVLFVEHDMDAVRDISDHVVVLAQGAIAAQGTFSEIAADPAVVDAYLGAHHGKPLEVRDE